MTTQNVLEKLMETPEIPTSTCAKCGQDKPSAEFRYRSTLKQAISRGFKRPYLMTSKYCRSCRPKRAAPKSERKHLEERVSYAVTGASNEHSYPLEERLKALDKRIIGKRRKAQFERWRQAKARVADPVIKAIDLEIPRIMMMVHNNRTNGRLNMDHIRILEGYILKLRAAKAMLRLYVRQPQGRGKTLPDEDEPLLADESLMRRLRVTLLTPEARIDHDDLMHELHAFAEGYALENNLIMDAKPLLGVKRAVL